MTVKPVGLHRGDGRWLHRTPAILKLLVEFMDTRILRKVNMLIMYCGDPEEVDKSCRCLATVSTCHKVSMTRIKRQRTHNGDVFAEKFCISKNCEIHMQLSIEFRCHPVYLFKELIIFLSLLIRNLLRSQSGETLKERERQQRNIKRSHCVVEIRA